MTNCELLTEAIQHNLKQQNMQNAIKQYVTHW